MTSSNELPELIASALKNAQESEARVNLSAQGNSSEATDSERRTAIVALEVAAIELFSVFEARQQHHFKRGPFSRKLKSALIEAGQTDLADRVLQYYLAINVLKHGKGASHRALLEDANTFIVLREPSAEPELQPSLALVDVTTEGFFETLGATLLEAYQFLEKK